MQDFHFVFERAIEEDELSVFVEIHGELEQQSIILAGVTRSTNLSSYVRVTDFIEQQLCRAIKATLFFQEGHVRYRLPGETQVRDLNVEIQKIMIL